MAWPDVTPDNLFAVPFLRAFWEAWAERAGAIIGVAVTPPAITTDTCPCQVGGNTGGPVTGHGIRTLQQAVRGLVGDPQQDAMFWLVPEAVLEGAADPRALGWNWDAGKPNSLVDVVLGGQGWRRKYHREIASINAAEYANPQADPPAAGHRALCHADGRVYRFDGSGWTLAPAGTAPDLVETHGECQLHDLYGPWIYQDVRAVLQRLVCTFRFLWLGLWTAHGTVNDQWIPTAGQPGQSFEAAKAQAETSWRDSPIAVVQADGYGPWACSDATLRDDGPPENPLWYSLNLARRVAMLWAMPLPTIAAKRVTWYAKAAAPQVAADRRTFDADGDGVREDAWHAWDEQLVTAEADRALSKPLGADRTALPAWIERPTVPWQLWTCGYECVDQGIVVRWDVEGGFTYP